MEWVFLGCKYRYYEVMMNFNLDGTSFGPGALARQEFSKNRIGKPDWTLELLLLFLFDPVDGISRWWPLVG